ncbi:MAG: hypothetical protein VX407_01900 [Verrucomicrobiota bacterium]|nr:hypothetical protein [Verrucomicrobiota bacterium]
MMASDISEKTTMGDLQELIPGSRRAVLQSIISVNARAAGSVTPRQSPQCAREIETN